ncbi:murein L,D-transpeptidase [Rhizobium sp. TRM95111]|uniref:L,D-transpeptidase family protein n=1 Tax=Rhizobium alarense TaxID=2846851 RepID=UPI001F1EB235|nr:murein L,D-transpeptidase family protein [Rhizobium alarense]MCF3639436.1 murein L,D-transpeptidase [Rhizobium alarense]
MRLTVLAAVSLLAVAAAGCTNETLDSVGPTVDVKTVKNKVEYQLSNTVLSRMASLNIDRQAPLMIRIVKEEGMLEVWKADRSNRFQMVKSYKICAWSGKLGPKVKEGDRQAPEGFYPLSRAHLNPNSSYYLAINTGYPNTYDRANGRSGSHLMIHGACSSSGCYSMSDEQMLEIFAFARDAFKGGQDTIQLQAFPFRMTAENMARHRDNPNIEFWKMLKVGYDHFQVTKRPPEVQVCDRKYVFNQQSDGKLNPTGGCPAMSAPAQLEAAMTAFNKSYASQYETAMKKYRDKVWIEPSEAQRKAIVAEQREGRELAYAPTGTSLDAGKLMTVREIEAAKKRAEAEARRREEMAERARQREEERKAKEVADAEADIAETRAEMQAAGRLTQDGVAVPAEKPNPAAAEEKENGDNQPFWKKLIASVGNPQPDVDTKDGSTSVVADPGTAAAETEQQVKPSAGQQAAATADAVTAGTPATGVDDTTPVIVAAPATDANAASEETPFWKFWKK